MTDRIDTARLRELAEAATPGPWWQEWVDGDDWWAVYGQPTGDMVCPEVCTVEGLPETSAEAAYIAAVNPSTMLDLLDALEKAETAVERVRELHTSGDEWCNFHESAFCDCAGVYCDCCDEDWPCLTISALYGEIVEADR